MTIYIALLRGINVGGHKSIAMADLRALCVELGLSDVQTVLQSGNLIFTAPASTGTDLEEKLETKLEKAADEHLGLSTTFIVRSAPDWLEITKNNPYPQHATNDPSHLVLALLKATPSKEAWEALQSAIKGREIVHGAGHQAYIYYPDGIGNSRLTNALIESKLMTSATARNWNTVLKLAHLTATVE
jgi:uncharacterized protein (DUF1697 family)